VRLFFALWPDDDARAHIARATLALRLAVDARPVPQESYHTTLAFVGEVSMPQLAVLQQIGRAQRGAACAIRFDAYDYWRDSQVVVAVARQSPGALTSLWAQLHRDLALLQPHRNPEHPQVPLRTHITLARKVAQAPVLPAMSPFDWNARSFSLVRSDTSGAHSVYTVVDTWQLLYETPKP
jgi:RNA 2',3'-cyclic 3'-phosphodiesterase